MLEPTRSNSIQYSEDFSNAAWLKTGLTVDTNKILSPYGSLDADEVNITTANAHYLFDTISVSASTNYTFTFYVKKGTATDVSYSILNEINFTNIVNTTSYFNEISDTEWTRISVEFTTPSGCTSIRTYPLRDGLSIGTVYIWGAQLEQGSYATSYIPTSGSAVTRVADSTSQTVPDGVIGQTEGVLFIEMDYTLSTFSSGFSPLYVGEGTYENAIYFSIEPNGVLYAVIWENGTREALINMGTLSQGINKIALSYEIGSLVTFLNGVNKGSDTPSALPSPNKIYLGQTGTSTLLQKTNVLDFKLYDTKLSNSELIALTTQ